MTSNESEVKGTILCPVISQHNYIHADAQILLLAQYISVKTDDPTLHNLNAYHGR